MEEGEVIRIRKDKILGVFKGNKAFATFLIISILAFLFSFLRKIDFAKGINIFDTSTWFILGILAGVSAFVSYHKKYGLSFYPILGWLVWISVKLRTRNVDGLRDVSTGGWTLGPDLDPFLFLRWAKAIVQDGTLYALDTMRYVPRGFQTKSEMFLLPYLIAWFHKVAVIFGSGSVEQSAAIFPVFMFAITVVAFFFLTRKILIGRFGSWKASIAAVISSFFLLSIPSLLPRTIAGIPEKESAAFFFLFMAFYFFLCAWQTKKMKWKIVNAVIAGIMTASMAIIWGGFIYIFVTLALTMFIAFVLGQVKKDKLYVYGTWLLSSSLIMNLTSNRYPFKAIITLPTTGIAVAVFILIVIHFVIFNTKLSKYFESGKLGKIPKPLVSILVTGVIGLVAILVLFGPGFVTERFNGVIHTLVNPVTDRLGVTVAENRQPFFGEWSRNFGPVINNYPVFFWLFFVGSVYLFYNMLNRLKIKDRAMLTLGYLIILISLIFSRYSPDKALNGTNPLSLFVYFGGGLLFVIIAGFYYYKYYKAGELDRLRSIDFGFIFLISFFFFSIISARGAVRLIMVLVPSVSIIVAYFCVATVHQTQRMRGGLIKTVSWILVALIIFGAVFSADFFYDSSKGSAGNYVPSVYTQQWQKAMAWVRENTAENSVFGHWWDYGYWIQTIGERATVLDGGNVITYWNHLMGRHVLTGSDDRKALDFLFAHGTTHILIDSTDIGKYTAFSSIGSNEFYDRRSWMNTFQKDETQTFENKNATVYFYRGGFSLDEDIIYEGDGGEKIFLPGVNDFDLGGPINVGGVGGVRFGLDNTGKILQPSGIFFYQGAQHELPLRYVYFGGQFVDFGTGVDAGVFVMPKVMQDRNQIDFNGALIYLSNKTVKSQLARLYLYGEDNKNFRIAHIEDDFIVTNIKNSGVDIGNFVYFNGVRGPIKIWEINYPLDITLDEAYLSKNFPDESLRF